MTTHTQPQAQPQPQPQLKQVACLHGQALHSMAYWEWAGPGPQAPVLVCVHGVSRQGRDFDTLARALCHHYRVVCPDVVGRGRSGWLANPMGYAIPQYVADMVTLLARLDAPQVDWVGTSMGGLIGLGLAALGGTPVRRLVLNDVGPSIEPASLARIGSYLGQPARWASLQEAADAMWQVSQSFGPHTPAQWLGLSEPQLKQDENGAWTPRYDPAIAVPFKAVTPELAKVGEAMLWAAYDSLKQPVLLLRGAESDLLSVATAQAMTQRGPRARLVEFAGVGHAPMLQPLEQVQAVAGFLLGP